MNIRYSNLIGASIPLILAGIVIAGNVKQPIMEEMKNCDVQRTVLSQENEEKVEIRIAAGVETVFEENAEIQHGNEAEAKVLADFILCENIVTEEVKTDDELEADSLVDFTIILGKDFDGRYVR